MPCRVGGVTRLGWGVLTGAGLVAGEGWGGCRGWMKKGEGWGLVGGRVQGLWGHGARHGANFAICGGYPPELAWWTGG